MIRLFSYLHDWMAGNMLVPTDYEIVFRCKSEKSKMFLEHVIEKEFAQLSMNFPSDYSPVRGNAGTCHNIRFELTR